uniref:Uncharacterized protein n=1 Tax=Arundo donax TaxID=35708 RepID=A0A0A9FXZ9_ARUDO
MPQRGTASSAPTRPTRRGQLPLGPRTQPASPPELTPLLWPPPPLTASGAGPARWTRARRRPQRRRRRSRGRAGP